MSYSVVPLTEGQKRELHNLIEERDNLERRKIEVQKQLGSFKHQIARKGNQKYRKDEEHRKEYDESRSANHPYITVSNEGDALIIHWDSERR